MGWRQEHERLMREAWARVHLEAQTREACATFGSWCGLPVSLPSEDAHEEYAFLVADDLHVDSSDAFVDHEDDYDFNPNVMRLRKPTGLVLGEEPKTPSALPFPGHLCRLEVSRWRNISASLKRARVVRQRRRRLCVARQEKTMLAL